MEYNELRRKVNTITINFAENIEAKGDFKMCIYCITRSEFEIPLLQINLSKCTQSLSLFNSPCLD